MPSYPLALTLIKLKNSVANLAQFQKGILTNLGFAPNVYKRDQSISSNLIFNALGFFGTFLSFSKFEPSKENLFISLFASRTYFSILFTLDNDVVRMFKFQDFLFTHNPNFIQMEYFNKDCYLEK